MLRKLLDNYKFTGLAITGVRKEESLRRSEYDELSEGDLLPPPMLTHRGGGSRSPEKECNVTLSSLNREKTSYEKRIAEINMMIKKLFEQSVVGGLSSERFIAMTKDYETEQETLKGKLSEINVKLSEISVNNNNIDRFILLQQEDPHF